ncbi:GlsB/YeaQ/YmgE family stress response membrane protein [Phenylobacterium sp.]|jgi:uncharacterized membrane protein YeaQ/YmgE (transglycosylase-associated protein family)|uniref:GlsB/YeaQ/YmgE family stress response membrane protein n=1 Tax=Phenylobacterium sp. TaxID=1871053 RepID=UPI002F934CE1
MEFIGAIIIGIIAGWIAEKVMRRNHGILTNLIVGVVGSFIGAFIANRLGWNTGDNVIMALLVAAGGAILLLFVWGLIAGRRRTAMR